MITAMAVGPGLLQFLQGGGEMGSLIRSKNWSATLLGPSESWPQSLKTTLGILLNSRYPMFVFWGPQLIKIYNDGYTPILGREAPVGPRSAGARRVARDLAGDRAARRSRAQR